MVDFQREHKEIGSNQYTQNSKIKDNYKRNGKPWA